MLIRRWFAFPMFHHRRLGGRRRRLPRGHSGSQDTASPGHPGRAGHLRARGAQHCGPPSRIHASVWVCESGIRSAFPSAISAWVRIEVQSRAARLGQNGVRASSASAPPPSPFSLPGPHVHCPHARLLLASALIPSMFVLGLLLRVGSCLPDSGLKRSLSSPVLDGSSDKRYFSALRMLRALQYGNHDP